MNNMEDIVGISANDDIDLWNAIYWAVTKTIETTGDLYKKTSLFAENNFDYIKPEQKLAA